MLAELMIHRIALIETLTLRLGNGLNTFTGETGAGKSIVLDAIGLLIGNRASTDMIRHGSNQAYVEGLFHVQGASLTRLNEMLVRWGLEEAEDGQCVVTRELFRSGRTVCRVNGRVVTVQMLRELGERLVQQHGQHDQQGLLRPEEQLRLLDLFGKHQALLAQVKALYELWSSIQEKWNSAKFDEQERIRRLDMLNFQITEIRDAKLVIGEEDQLREQRERLKHIDRVVSALDDTLAATDGVDRQRGAYELLVQASQQLAVAVEYDADLREALQLLESAQIYTEEASRMLSRHRSSIDDDPALLSQVEERLVVIRGLERKYGATVADVLEFVGRAERERDELGRFEEHRHELHEQLQTSREKLLVLSRQLQHARTKSAHQLSRGVEDVLRQLNMPNAQISIEVITRGSEDEPELGPNGMDSVTFLFSANKGEPAKALQKIASGGELSRTLLALKSVLAEVDDLDTLIFDEIDAGVSGLAAEQIGRQLRDLGATHQVLCVTHSPQIAASGRVHFSIEKQEREQDTTTRVTELDEGGRIQELARLLGAGLADETAEHHARALLHSYWEESKL